ncbi:MAG TPA: hypothetical protein VML53_05795 [Thermoplasmata archaeon]|nr:hypothetical protein [Thermoplasmata archaeon]
MRSASSRSTGRSGSRAADAAGVEAYLFPAVVGGGLGDIEEVLAAGRRLARAGVPVRLYRRPGRPLPRHVDGPWAWPPHRRIDRLPPAAGAALTVSPAWGISAAPAGPPPLGRPGPWAEEAADIERAYGSDRTIHVSLEEFARTLTVREETVERFREGGVRARAIPSAAARARRRGEVATFDRAFRRFRAFDRANVLHLFASFRRDRRFARQFPEAVQTGPLWSGRIDGRRPVRRRRSAPAPWVWYASPASAEAIFPEVAAALRSRPTPCALIVRSPRSWRTAPPPGVVVSTTPWAPAVWRRRFEDAPVRIVTGSRSLLEALELGRPFLYFNGVLGDGPARRRHRPEKIVALLARARRARWPVDVRRDLADFARGRRLGEVVRRAADRRGGWGRPWPRVRPEGFSPPFDDGGAVVVAAARALAQPGASAAEIVADLRSRSNA